IQQVWAPIHFTLFFGSYDWNLPDQILMIALIRIVMRMREQLDVTADPASARDRGPSGSGPARPASRAPLAGVPTRSSG
ncbi:hypothetical protein HQ590_06630, partial [bacterium]|nr:hypothetical protein [bacterium]